MSRQRPAPATCPVHPVPRDGAAARPRGLDRRDGRVLPYAARIVMRDGRNGRVSAAPLPAGLRARADVAGNGELLWPHDAVSEAIAWMAGQGLGIVCVEAYARVAQARGSFEGEWPVAPGWRAGEPWETYVARAASQAAATIEQDGRAHADAMAGDRDNRRYFLAATSEDAYPPTLREPQRSLRCRRR